MVRLQVPDNRFDARPAPEPASHPSLLGLTVGGFGFVRGCNLNALGLFEAPSAPIIDDFLG